MTNTDTVSATGRPVETLAITLAGFPAFASEIDALGGRKIDWPPTVGELSISTIVHCPPTLLNRNELPDRDRGIWDDVYPDRLFVPREIHEQAIFEVPNGRLIAPAWACLTPNNQILRWSYRVGKFFNNPNVARNRVDATIDIAQEQRHLKGRIGTAGPMEYSNFYHWMIEGFPRAQMLKATYGDEFRLALPRKLPPFVMESLMMIGFHEQQIVPVARRYTYTCDVVLMATTPIRSIVDYSAWLPKWFNSLFRSSNDKPAEASLYISRRKAGARRVLNERELVRALGPEFEVVDLEKLSLSQQIGKIRSARNIVSPHGAGLAHMFFADPDCKLVELIPNSVRAPSSFWAICDQKGLDYAAVVGDAVAPERGGNSDFTIPEESFELIKAFLKRK